MIRNIKDASEQYRDALKICREVFSAAGQEFVEPKGPQELLANARKLYTEQADEAKATKEVEHARDWLTGIATKFLRGGVGYYGGRINELRYMALDRDLMEQLDARFEEFEDVMRDASGFQARIAAFQKLASAVNNALPEQRRRVEHRELMEDEEASRKEQERRQRRRQQEEEDRFLAKQRQEAVEAAARELREKQFDELFG